MIHYAPWVAAALLLASPALAHKGSKAHVRLTVDEATVKLSLRATAHTLAPTLGVAPGLNPAPVLFRTKQATVLRNITAFLTLRSAGRQCALASQRLEVVDQKKITARITYRCPRRVELLELTYDVLFDAHPRHRAFVTAGQGAGARARVLTRSSRVFRLEQEVSPWTNAVEFLVLGLEHIITGYDHLAFLLGLLLVVGAVRHQRGGLWPALRYLLAIVTSFTVAHSVTLVGTAMGWLSVPSRLVEPAIALSIVYVGVENLLVAVPRRRWLLTFAFGLVHGFGFAHMLRDIGLPHNGLVLSLAAFNLGVELGQVAVVAVCVLLLAVAMTRIPQRWYRAVVVRGGSVVVALLGILWLTERVLGVTLLGF